MDIFIPFPSVDVFIPFLSMDAKILFLSVDAMLPYAYEVEVKDIKGVGVWRYLTLKYK